MVAIPNPGKHPTRRQRDEADRESLQQLPPDEALQQLFNWLLGASARRCKLAIAALAERGGPAVVSGLSTMLLQRPPCPEEVQSRCLAVLELVDLAPTRDLTVALDLLAESGTAPIRLRAGAVAAKLRRSWVPPLPLTSPTPPCPVAASRVRLSKNPAPTLETRRLTGERNLPEMTLSHDDREDVEHLRGLTGAEVRREVLGWFAGTDKRRLNLATALLIEFGQRVLPDMTEALRYGSARPDLQLRVLEVIKTIGGPPTPELTMVLAALVMFGRSTRLSMEAGLVFMELSRSPAPTPASQAITTTSVSEDLNDLCRSRGEKADSPLGGWTGAGTPAAQHILADGDGIETPAKSAGHGKAATGDMPPKHPDDPIAGFVPDKGGWDGPRLDLTAACAACSKPVGRAAAAVPQPLLQAETRDAVSPPRQGPLLQAGDGGQAGQDRGPG